MKLEQLTKGPVVVGTIIRWLNGHSGAPVEVTMEVVELELDRSMGMIIRDVLIKIHGRVTFEALTQDRTNLVIDVEFPRMDGSVDISQLTSLMERSAQNIKTLIES